MTIEIDVRTDGADEVLARLADSLDGMSAGTQLRLLAGTDVEPTRQQLSAQRAGEFAWQTTRSGPDVWEAEVTSLVHRVDARPTLAAGGEPFEEIMRTAAQVEPGQALVVVAPFDPVPLQGVLGAQGFSYESTPIGDGDFRVVFRRD